ncbi:ATP-dependent DNA helicase [Abortiporus biennis]
MKSWEAGSRLSKSFCNSSSLYSRPRHPPADNRHIGGMEERACKLLSPANFNVGTLHKQIVVVDKENTGRLSGQMFESRASRLPIPIPTSSRSGCTIHSWAGIGLGKEVKEMLVCRLIGGHKWTEEKEARELALKDGVSYFADPSDDSWLGNSPAMRRWIITKTLIIDEISMIDGELFDKLDFIARIIRRNDKPFGGIQLVLSGDFCQLPPVPDKLPNGEKKKVTFAFESQSWKRCIGRPVILTKVFRQKDQDFIDMLNAMRYGHVSKDTDVKFKHLARTVVYEDGIEPSELFPKRDQVDNANSKRLESLCTPAKAYNAIDTPGIDERGYPVTQFKMDDLLKPLVAKEQIVLKVGAQVMLIKNLVQGELVNGSVGIVVGFSTCREADRAGTQIAQFDSVENDPNEGGLQENIQQLTRLDRILMRRNEHYPVVRFQNGWRVLCIPATFEVNNLNSTVAASREQVPLILAWALSIHKSQGQTLERVRVNLRSTFEKGQAYVALSRATSMETLQVLNFNSTCVMAHERVLTWMREQTDDSTSNTPLQSKLRIVRSPGNVELQYQQTRHPAGLQFELRNTITCLLYYLERGTQEIFISVKLIAQFMAFGSESYFTSATCL